MEKSSKYEDLIKFLKCGKICLFETDTVVGVSTKVFHDKSINNEINKIFDIKNRSRDKALPWLISSTQMLNEFIAKIPEYAKNFIENKWPGATTLIFEVKDFVPKNLGIASAEGKQSVAFRMPDCEELITAIDYINCPIATTSANVSGKPSVASIKDVDPIILQKVDFVYDKPFHKDSIIGASEIISCLGKEPKILRAAQD